MKRSSLTIKRTRKCAICRNPFERRNMTQKVCGPDCAIALVTKLKAKQERLALALRKEAIKTLTDWIADTQKVFNAYIRKRDEDMPCICCGRDGGAWSRGGIWDCGHFRSRGSAGHLRFDERNAHKQLKQCNSYGSGQHANYRVGLITRIGLQAVEALESDQTIHKWTIDELKAIKVIYKAKLKELNAEVNHEKQ